MRHRKAGKKLGRLTAHRRALHRNLLLALFEHERIVTTESKAKVLRPLADHVITLAKREHLHARRQVLTLVPNAKIVKKIFDTVAARYIDRHGGYTRVFLGGRRSGDGAQTALIELIDRPEAEKEKTDKKGKKEKAEKKAKAEKGGLEAKAGKGKTKKAKAAAAAG